MIGKIVDLFGAIALVISSSMLGAAGGHLIAVILNKSGIYISPEVISMITISVGALWGISGAVFLLYHRGTFHQEKANDALKLAEEGGSIARSISDDKE